MSQVALAYCLLSAGVGSLLYLLGRRGQPSKSPPGPPKDPFIGHLRYMPSEDAALVFHDWAKRYGDVMQLEIVGQRIIVLDTHRAAVDLLDKRSAIYSDRPEFPLYTLLGWTFSLGFLRYGKTFARHREVLQRGAAPRKQSHRLSPNEYNPFLSRFSTSIITRITVGHQIVSPDDPYVQITNAIYQAISRTGPPGGSPVDLFPFLRHFPNWFPGASDAGVARAWRPAVRRLYDYPLESVERELKAGEASPSFLLSWLEDAERNTGRDDIQGLVAAMFGAGEATTWSAVTLFILAMVLHPECQATAQKELDSVLGGSRLPEFGDRENIPYIDCIVQETLRGISLDETVYKDATSFHPERFLPKPLGNGEPPFTDTFGFGRRICPGRDLADNSLWIAIATILATCSISNALDSNGEKIIPEVVMSDGLARARFASAQALLREESELAA
ncbi:cytochrome P450 [Mycena filopes]|nr:cytochrome P450 [Mycena filopes]